MIAKSDFIAVADKLKLNVAALMAVAEVESSGSGMTTLEGKDVPTILFEPHVYYSELKAAGINPELHLKGNEDILYRKWKTRPYPRSQAERHAQLAKACALHREAALKSASYGRFQIMGFNHAACGCKTIQEFINAMYASEAEQLRLFGNFIEIKGLIKYLQRRDWDNFALRYNGEGYKQHKYHVKLADAYKRYSA
jgi:hypothetical protein